FRQSILEIRAAEIGEVVFVGTAERAPVAPRGRDRQRRVVLEVIKKSAGVARGYHDDLPANACRRKQGAQLLRRQVAQVHAIHVQRHLVLFRAVTGQVNQQDVL